MIPSPPLSWGGLCGDEAEVLRCSLCSTVRCLWVICGVREGSTLFIRSLLGSLSWSWWVVLLRLFWGGRRRVCA